MQISRVIQAAVIAAVVAFASAPIIVPQLGRLLRADVPNERSSHQAPTPRGGGLIVAVGLVAAWALRLPAERTLVAAGVSICLFGLIGLIDDVHPLDARVRLAAQTGAGAVALTWLVPIAPDGVAAVGFCAGAIIMVVGFVNAFNFMDGINGISGLHGAVGGFAFAAAAWKVDAPAVAVLSAALCGASIGFLPTNLRRRPRAFLGDVGSYLLGAALATCALLVWRAGATMEAAVAPLALYVVDTTITVIRRARRRENIMAAHREHVYQRLTPPAASHAPVALLTATITTILSALGFASIGASAAQRAILALVSIVLLSGYVTLPERAIVVRRLHPETSA